MRIQNYNLTEEEANRKIHQWAEITAFSLRLKLRWFRTQHPDLSDYELQKLMWDEIIRLKEAQYADDL